MLRYSAEVISLLHIVVTSYSKEAMHTSLANYYIKYKT